jgi:hypothetical protein
MTLLVIASMLYMVLSVVTLYSVVTILNGGTWSMIFILFSVFVILWSSMSTQVNWRSAVLKVYSILMVPILWEVEAPSKPPTPGKLCLRGTVGKYSHLVCEHC